MKRNVCFGTIVLLVAVNLFCYSVYGEEEKFIEPCSDAGGYYGWLGSPGNNHLGHDYNAPSGTEVKAIANGIVFKVVEIAAKCYDPETKKEVSQPFVWIRHQLSDGQYFYALYGHIEPLLHRGRLDCPVRRPASSSRCRWGP